MYELIMNKNNKGFFFLCYDIKFFFEMVLIIKYGF